MSEPRKSQLSYVRLPDGKSTVTCTCGWRDPLGPVPPSPFDPAEALHAAFAAHPCCPPLPDPKNITGATTLIELREQRELLRVQAMMLFPAGMAKPEVTKTVKISDFGDVDKLKIKLELGSGSYGSSVGYLEIAGVKSK